MALWGGRFEKGVDAFTQEFGASLEDDKAMAQEDIKGSRAHAKMLAKQGIISGDDAAAIDAGLEKISGEIANGTFAWDVNDEDIHMAVEKALTADIGTPGARLHTGRSRNDQVATDIRLYVKRLCEELLEGNVELRRTLLSVAEKNLGVVMPGYTHLQHAQPVLFSHHMLAYFWMFSRDYTRLVAARTAADANPLGSAALAGTTYPLDRDYTTQLLGFDHAIPNSMDAVSDRDYLLDLGYACAVSMMHLSRLSEELVLWSSWEFQFVQLSDSYTTGSSIMPQKKNPDMAELVRGKTGRVYGDLIAMLTALKGLPLAYNKDMQEDKEAVFDAVDTVKMCLRVMAPMLATMTVRADKMLHAAQTGFLNATDLADYLVTKGLPFRSAYKVSGQLVAYCIAHDTVLEKLPLETFRTFSDLFDDGVYAAIDLKNCVTRRVSYGGTSVPSVEAQIAWVTQQLEA